MRKILFTSCFILFVLHAFAQNGNEWVKFNQSYFKIPVAKDGLYKLTYSNLQSAGFPVDAVDPRRVQIFHRGVEQAIYIQGEGDAKFDATDFIMFYGKRNDGTMDAELYRPSNLQPHTFHNLFSDTTSYFLSFNPLAVFGKRMATTTDINVTGIPKETYHLDQNLLVLGSTYSTGLNYSDYLQTSFFDSGEGWNGPEIQQTLSADYTLSGITLTNTAAPVKPRVEVLLVGRSFQEHNADIQVGTSFRTIATASFTGYTTSKISQTIEWSDIAVDGKLVVRVKVNGVGGEPDRLAVCYIKLTYPQQYDASGTTEKIFNLIENPANKSYIEVQNPGAGLQLFDITDPNNLLIIRTTSTATLNAVIPSASVTRNILATSTSLTPASIKPISFRQIIPSQYNFIVISNQVLMRPALGYSDPVRAYAGYRASSAGGKYDTLVMDINQLYNEFNYGEESPLAVFHFMKFLCATHRPDYLFIIGKGLAVDNGYYRDPSNPIFNKFRDLVPTAGLPASDMFFTVGLSGTTNEPAVPTGRIPASSPAQVAAYLDKVKEMEALPFNALWRKNILHLSGGIDTGEPEEFKSYMQDFQAIAEGPYLGAKVKAIPKQTTNIELINISEEVNKGLNLVTFYGHSSPSVIDFYIGFASDPVLGYNNPGKYPTLLMNGCNAGAFFNPSELFGENWINQPNKGAIGFIAHSSYGLKYLLKQYTDNFYSVGYGDSVYIHKGLGDIQKQVAKQFIQNLGNSAPNVSQVQQMILLGDPAVRLFGAKKVDYEINENSIFIESFDGAPITALTDSFSVNIIVRNFGQAKQDQLVVGVTQTFSNTTTTTIHKIFPPVKYTDTLTFVIHKNNSGGFGNNTFTVKVDSDDLIPELSETNNTASKSLLIPLNGTKNLYPYDYAIVNSKVINLFFQSTDLLSGQRDFLIELDTLHTFTSSYKQQFTANGKVLANKSVTILSKDSLAYYWRTKLKDPLPGESTDWTVNSFTYINNGSDGWAQVHFPQYLKNESVGLVNDISSRQFKFEETETDIAIRTFGVNNPATNLDVSVKLNNAEYNLSSQGGQCRTNSINLLAFDKTSTVPYAGVPFKIVDPRSCGREPQVIDNFVLSEMETGKGDDILQYVDNVVAGDSVILFSIGNAGYNSWTANVKNKLGELGISVAQINALVPGEPVVIFGKKGSLAGSAKIFRASGSPADTKELLVNETITGRYTSGKMKSVVIGPAKTWTRFIKKTGPAEPADQFSFDIIGIKLSGQEALIQGGVTTDMDLSGIDAQNFPFLKIRYTAEDDINLTPVQLKKWFVMYEPMAEGILIYKGPLASQKLQEGDPWTGNYGFVNISNKNFNDSLAVNLEVFNNTQRTSAKSDFKIHAPIPGDTTSFKIAVDTKGKVGLNDLNVFVNPHILPEQYYDNNLLQLLNYLNVLPDVYKPVLDVTVDGRYLLNGDFVSPNPNIVVALWDENKIALKKDTLGVNVFLKYPCLGCDFKRLNFSQGNTTWVPATDTTNFKAKFNPQNLPVGKYALLVEATDAHGNLTGKDPYEVNFIVTDESAITLQLPYPNPSTGRFSFSMLISGADLPETFNLQMTTVDGKMVKEINLDKDSFHIGANTLVLDPTDSNLQNGIYIYHLLVKTPGQEIRKNGKLVLIQ